MALRRPPQCTSGPPRGALSVPPAPGPPRGAQRRLHVGHYHHTTGHSAPSPPTGSTRGPAGAPQASGGGLPTHGPPLTGPAVLEGLASAGVDSSRGPLYEARGTPRYIRTPCPDTRPRLPPPAPASLQPPVLTRQTARAVSSSGLRSSAGSARSRLPAGRAAPPPQPGAPPPPPRTRRRLACLEARH